MSVRPRLFPRTVAVSACAVVLAGASFAPALAGDGKGKGEGKGHDKKAAGAEPRNASEEAPRGNNGTFKVDGLAFDEGLGNEPHVTCEFRLKFYGFDQGQTGDITIAGHAPSGSGAVSTRADVPLIGALAYAADDLDLDGLTAHPQQGYHVKATIATGEPGGVKHKVFWIEPCETTPQVSGTQSVVPPARQTETVPTAVLGTKLTRPAVPAKAPAEVPAAAPAAEVLGTGLTRQPLAFTGSFAEALLALAGGLLVAGTGVLLLARRRSRDVA